MTTTTLLTTFYQDSHHERQAELNFSLQWNLDNEFIDKVVLFVDLSFPISSISHPKVTFIRTNARIPSYGDFLNYASTLPDGSIVVIANSDICYDEEIKKIRTWDLDRRLVVLSRKEGRPKTTALLTEHHHSSDTWILKTPLLTSSCDISLGKLHCETAFICKMQQAGYQVSNASLSVSSFHIHESGKRNYSPENSPYENLYAQAFPLISGAYASGLISCRTSQAPLLISTGALSSNKIAPYRIWSELLPLLAKYLPPETAFLSHGTQSMSSLGFPIVHGPVINPALALQETTLLDNICAELGTTCFLTTSGSIPGSVRTIAPIYDLKYELTHTNSTLYCPEVFTHRFSQNNFFFDEATMNLSRSLFDPLNAKDYCLLPKGKFEFFSLPGEDSIPLADLGINRQFFLLVGERTGFAGGGNAECLFTALSHNELYRRFQIVCVGGGTHIEKQLINYPSARDTILLHPADSILKKLYRHAFAHISTARIKGVELSNIEAMQSRCPVVVVQYDNPYREYWGNCLTTPTLDGECLQEIVTLLENTNTRDLVGQAGFEYTNTLSYENTAKRLGEFIQEVYRAPNTTVRK